MIGTLTRPTKIRGNAPLSAARARALGIPVRGSAPITIGTLAPRAARSRVGVAIPLNARGQRAAAAAVAQGKALRVAVTVEAWDADRKRWLRATAPLVFTA